MGKIKRKRTKLHTPAAREKDVEAAVGAKDTPSIQPVLKMPDNVFSKLDIDLASLQRQLASGDDLKDDDVRSAVTSKSVRGLNLKKKEKRKLRREVWMKKVDIIQSVKREAKAKKQRQQTAVIGDMRPLEETLPTLDLLLRETTSHRPEASLSKPKAIEKTQTRQKQMLKDIALFHQVSAHPEFKASPASTITQHLRNKLKQEEEAMDS